MGRTDAITVALTTSGLLKSQGPDAQVTILVEISEDYGTTYETMFSGLLDITSIKETDFYKLESGVIRNDFGRSLSIERELTLICHRPQI